jgi:hypothetical protein
MTTIHLTAIAALLGASLLASSPTAARADQGKWWTPKSSRGQEPRRVERVERRHSRAVQRGWDRQWRRWRGDRVYRDAIVIRDSHRGPRYRAWRYYSNPIFHYRRHIVYLRPVRYYVSAAAVIGGVRLHARFHDHDDYLYGCNFCDARFDSYGHYRAHVYECELRPHGYRIVASDWDDREWRNEDWWDDRHWEGD